MPHTELFLRRDTQPEEKHSFKADLFGCHCIEALASTFCESFAFVEEEAQWGPPYAKTLALKFSNETARQEKEEDHSKLFFNEDMLRTSEHNSTASEVTAHEMSNSENTISNWIAPIEKERIDTFQKEEEEREDSAQIRDPMTEHVSNERKQEDSFRNLDSNNASEFVKSANETQKKASYILRIQNRRIHIRENQIKAREYRRKGIKLCPVRFCDEKKCPNPEEKNFGGNLWPVTKPRIESTACAVTILPEMQLGLAAKTISQFNIDAEGALEEEEEYFSCTSPTSSSVASFYSPKHTSSTAGLPSPIPHYAKFRSVTYDRAYYNPMLLDFKAPNNINESSNNASMALLCENTEGSAQLQVEYNRNVGIDDEEKLFTSTIGNEHQYTEASVDLKVEEVTPDALIMASEDVLNSGIVCSDKLTGEEVSQARQLAALADTASALRINIENLNQDGIMLSHSGSPIVATGSSSIHSVGVATPQSPIPEYTRFRTFSRVSYDRAFYFGNSETS